MGPPLRLSKPPLITPSASPPRFSSRLSEHPSPSKKQRRTQTPVPDVQKEREASTLRLLDVWASLAERYSRHMDDDDLVDIRTGEIIKDNGVWRNAPTLRFGTLAAPVDEMNEVDDDDEEEEDGDEDEYDLDELDAFAETGIDTDEEAKSELDTGGLFVPPATSLEQANADDLRDFLEAEKVRKEQCGTDVDEESDEQQSLEEDSGNITDEVLELDVVRVAERQLGRSYDELQELETPPQDDEYKEDGLKLIEGQGACSEPIVIASDDELDLWKADSNAVRAVHDRINVHDSDNESLGSVPPFSFHKLPPKDRTPRPQQLHTPPRSYSSSKPSISPLTTECASDLSGDDSSPTGRHRKRALLKQKNPHDRPISPQLPKSMARPSTKIFCRDHSPYRENNAQISPVPSSKGSTSKPKQRPVVLLTPRKALEQPAKPTNSHISSLDRNGGPHDALPEASSSRMLSRRKGKEKERVDMIVATPDNHSTGRNFKIPKKTELYGTDTGIDAPASESTQIRTDFVEASPKQSGKRPQPHPLKRKRDSYSTVDVSEITMERASPRRQVASGSHSSYQNRSTSSNYLPPTNWHSRESRTESDSDSENEELHSEQIQRVRQKRSASCVETRVPPPPHFLHTYATPNHQNQFTHIPDPRAQLIIAQAVQQLSALVTGIWQPPVPHYLEGSTPRTPQRRSMSTQPSSSFHTPTSHPHMYPFLYDPAFSGASFPPESPEPEHHTITPQRSLKVSRSHSRVRKVSFLLNDEESDTQEVSDIHRTPTSNRRTMNADGLSKANSKRGDHGSLEGPRRSQTPGPNSKVHRENNI